MPPQRETTAPRHKADKRAATPAQTSALTAALTPAQPGLGTTLRTLGARAALLTATTLPVVASPFFLTSAAAPPSTGAAALASTAHYDQADPIALAQRELRASRSSAARILTPVTMKPRAIDTKWATADLNVWEQPGEKGRRFGVLDDNSKVALTGQVAGRWAEVLVDGRARWVNAKYLTDEKPEPAVGGAATGGISTAPCPDGSGTESGITSNTVMMFRAVCNAFPVLTTYGGYDAHGEHADGRAVDFMISGSTGYAVAEWARANAAALNIRTIIYAQRIWTPERSAEGWRAMSDRGSTTANHYDHVHISVY